jgi:hypothetical protein
MIELIISTLVITSTAYFTHKIRRVIKAEKLIYDKELKRLSEWN